MEAPNQREILLQQKIAELSETSDLLGLGIEPGIKETLAYLNLLGVNTSSSCEGHNTEERISLPYIQGHAESKPDFRYTGEEVVVKGILSKYGLNQKNEIFGNPEAEDEYYALIENLDESPEYMEWYSKNQPLEKEVEGLISEFNAGDSDFKLHMVPHYPGYRVEVDFGHERNRDVPKEEAKKLVEKAQKTFKEFEEFLKNKYLAS